MFKKIFIIILKSISLLLLAVLLAVLATSVSPIYDFSPARPFSGPDIFNPYSKCAGPAGSHAWKRANFHTHTRVEGLLNECQFTPAETDSIYRSLGYDIVTFSNHNEITVHPYDSTLQVNVYEHGYNLFKYHKLVFGCGKVNHFDHLIPLFTSQKQFQLDLLGRDADFIQMNHPLRTTGTNRKEMESLEGYRIMELDSGKSTENTYWDWALSAGHYSFALANDDLHYPDRSDRIAVRCNFLDCGTGSYADLRETLLGGCYYSMRVPDYGYGDWGVKRARNRELPSVESIGVDGDCIYISLSQKADSIRFSGQDHTMLAMALNSSEAEYSMAPGDSYARITAWFPDGVVIYTNPFARYDASVAESPYCPPSHSVNVFLTILFNLALLLLAAGVVWAGYKIVRR